MFTISSLASTATRVLSGAKFSLIKHSPEILLVGGIASIGVGVVAACKGTLKVEQLKKERDERIEECENSIGEPLENGENYTEKDRDDDIDIFKKRHILNVAKAYLPACILLVAGVTAVIFGHKITADRLKGTAKALAATTATLAIYKNRIKEIYGDEDAIWDDITETTTKHENGEEIVVGKRGIPAVDIPNTSPYTFLFDEYNHNYDYLKTNSMIASFLQQRMSYWNTVLDLKGHVFLNDVLRDLGFEKCKMGQVCGWVKNRGDSCIDFGVQAESFIKHAGSHEFDGTEPLGVVLDFNCEGNILDYAF